VQQAGSVLSIRQGPWKYLATAGSRAEQTTPGRIEIFRLAGPAPDAASQLYNLTDDPGETNTCTSRALRSMQKSVPAGNQQARDAGTPGQNLREKEMTMKSRPNHNRRGVAAATTPRVLHNPAAQRHLHFSPTTSAAGRRLFWEHFHRDADIDRLAHARRTFYAGRMAGASALFAHRLQHPDRTVSRRIGITGRCAPPEVQLKKRLPPATRM